MKARNDTTFPHATTLKRFGSKANLLARVAAFCTSQPGWDDVAALCSAVTAEPDSKEPEPERTQDEVTPFGFVYLLRSGKFHKIGCTNAAGRRERELQIQLPEKAAIVHKITTDDPAGIEAYWHRSFAERRKNGEWFELSAQDVAAFKRRKFT